MTSWTEMFTYGTEIAYDFVNILLKYYKNLDVDGSGSLNREEFRMSYAKMSLLSAYVEMDILDTNNDGLLNGNELKTFQTLTVRGANVCFPSESLFRFNFALLPVNVWYSSGLTISLRYKRYLRHGHKNALTSWNHKCC